MAKNSLELVMNEINKKYKSNIVRKGTELDPVAKIPFSSPRANYITYGGIPRGKATELFGPENGGKTTTAIDIVAQAQQVAWKEYQEKLITLQEEMEKLQESGSKSAAKRLKGAQSEHRQIEEKGPQKVVYVDSENTLDEEWAETNGVDTEDLILIRPQDQTAEQVLQMMLDLITTEDVILMVLDSIPMLVPKQIYDEDMDKKMYGGVSGPMSEFSRRVSGLIGKTNTALIMINQIREEMNSQYIAYRTPGGKALKHLYALRLLMSKGSLIDENNNEIPNRSGEPAGNLVSIKIEKTKVCKPNRKIGFYTLNYTTGIDVLADTIDIAIWNDLIQQAGSWFSIMEGEDVKVVNDEPLKFQGKAKLIDYLRSNENEFNRLKAEVENRIK